MAEKLLYYFGAGASAQKFPIARSVQDTHGNIAKFGLADELANFNPRLVFESHKTQSKEEWVQQLSGRFKAVAKKANEFGDVDTYAKFLQLMYPGGDELKEVKRVLSIYFSLKQTLLGVQDSRYLPWLVSIMNKRTFPDNVKILSWNYDYQMELAAAQLLGLEDVAHENNSFVHSPSALLCYPNLDPTFSDNKRLSLIHLNGVAGFVKRDNLNTMSVFQKKYHRQITETISFLDEEALDQHMHFAWEESSYHRDLLKDVEFMIADTTILVVIGYSFPFFNREVDKKVFEKLKTNGRFRKIYYQDPFLTGDQLRAQFGLPKNIEIVHISNVTNFYIPFEY